jgi:hypothetical protein
MAQCHIKVTPHQYARLKELALHCAAKFWHPNSFDEVSWQEGVKRILGITPKLRPSEEYLLVVQIKDK